MIQLAPSILSADFSNLSQDVQKVQEGGAHLLHIDVMDGHFVPNISIGALIPNSLVDKTTMPFDVHLMIENPDIYLEQFVFTNTEYISVHAEACVHLHIVVQQIKSFGVKAGVAINPSTSLSALEQILPDLDMVLLMSVNPGFGGQRFIKSSLEKALDLKGEIKRRGLSVKVEMDGGINLENTQAVIDSGVDIIVAGSAIFHSHDIISQTKKFIDLF